MPVRSDRVMDFDDEPGFLGLLFRPVMRRPMDSFASAVAVAASIAIVLNALSFQTGPHPAPIFAPAQPPRVEAVPRPTPQPAPRTIPTARPTPAQPAAPVPVSGIAALIAPQSAPAQQDMVRAVQAELARLGRYDGAVDGLFGPKTDFAIREWERATGRAPTGEPNQKVLDALKVSRAPQPSITNTATATPSATTPSKRILAIQQVLAEQGYGPIKLDGLLGEGTKAAIFRFEVHRNLPPTGELSPRFVRELSAVSGVSLE